MLKRLLPYLLLFILATIPRFFSLNVIPTSLSHDEVDLIIQAHSVRLTGTDLSGSWNPWSLLPNDAVMAELAPVINLPALSILPNTLFAAHATTALLGSLYPLLIVILLISWGMSHRVAWLTGFLLALSPWHILFSRTTLEQPTSLFFYTLSWIFLSKIFSTKNNLKMLLLSTFSFITFYSLGFYTYHGFKFVLPIMTAFLALYSSIRSSLKYKLPLLVLAGLTISGLYLRIYINSSSYSSRQSEIIFMDQARFAKAVDNDRRTSLLPDRLNQLFSNKPIEMLKLATEKYLSTISPEQLFMKGEKNGVFSTGRTGYLYLFLLPFVLIGIASMLMSGKRSELIALVLLFISPLATVIHQNDSFAFRSAIFIVLLTMVAAIGIEAINTRYPKLRLSLVAVALTVISFVNFSFVYLGYYPVESARAYFFTNRLLASYLSHSEGQRILVIDPQPRYIMSYLALTNRDVTDKVLSPLIGNYSPSEEKNTYLTNGITIRRDCPKELGQFDTIIVDSSLREGLLGICPTLDNMLLENNPEISKISDPLDGGDKKIIYNDLICQGVDLPRYVNLSGLSGFALDEMSRVQFCSNWIIQN